MDAIGLTAGWRVWEVGAGGPSVPAWIAARTGGPVLATDIDTVWLSDMDESVDVVRHDVGVVLAPDGQFDLVHARLVLVHVTNRERSLATMVEALAPGGWLLLEEADPGLQRLVCPDEVGDAERLANRLKHGFRTLMAKCGVDLAFSRMLPRLLRSVGLDEVESDAYFPMGSPTCTELERATIEQIRDQLIEHGLATPEEIERHLNSVTAGALGLATPPMVSVWDVRRLDGPVHASRQPTTKRGDSRVVPIGTERRRSLERL